MENKPQIPERIENSIGYEGWTALSWALHHNWVSNYKWLFSEMKGFDVGTPLTVMGMLSFAGLMNSTSQFYTWGNHEPDRNEFGKIGTRGLFMIAEKVNAAHIKQFYEFMVEGYLLGTDFVSNTLVHLDDDGSNQLVGELRRYWAREIKSPIQPKKIILNREIVQNYCEYYGLEGVSESFIQRLRL